MDKVHVYSNGQMADIKAEFSRLKDTCYLDHAGATLYSERQLQNVLTDLSQNVYANPHARSTTSQATIDAIDIVRFKILTFFNAASEDYSVIFTSGTTQGLKLIAETFDFNGGTLAYLEDNHTSVLGMRNFAANFREVKVGEAFNILSGKFDSKNSGRRNGENCLFVYPAQSNFAGIKYPLSWINKISEGALERPSIKARHHQNWYTLLDAACFASTNFLDLHKYQPDFVTLSFYKIFGYPTGLGALLVKRSSEHLLKKRYLGGGTVLMALSSQNTMVPRPNIQERFEDGTVPFLSILSLSHGFDTLQRLQLTPQRIALHTFNLAKYTFERMLQLHHSNGEPVAVLYQDSGFESVEVQGGIVNFNLKRFDGGFVGYAEVLHIANLHGIQLRTGCFCNPGACQRFLELSSNDVRKHFEAGHVCGDQHDLVDGYPTGSVRISFGYMSTFEDADRFLHMIEKCFVTHPVVRKRRQFNKNQHFYNKEKEPLYLNGNNEVLKSKKLMLQGYESNYLMTGMSRSIPETGKLVKIYLYPVKSCAAFEVDGSWKLTKIGLEYDRRWMIVNASGSCVSQKQIKGLCALKPVLDSASNTLKLRMNDTEMAVPLEAPNEASTQAFFCDSKVCGDKVQGYDCGDKVAEWLSDNLERPGLRLLRQRDFSGRTSKEGQQTLLSLANKAEYLLINAASARWLMERLPQEDSLSHTLESLLLRFRANFVVDLPEPFMENDLDVILCNGVEFKFLGPCTRCQIICIDQQTGEISQEPLQTLSRELKGKMRFGGYLRQCDTAVGTCYVKTGSTVNAYFTKNV